MNEQKHIIILGAGYGGLAMAFRLAGKTKPEQTRITVVNASDVFVERVRLHQVAANQELPTHVIPKMLKGLHVDFVRGWVMKIHPNEHRIEVETDKGLETLTYDRLVYALGSYVNRDAIEGIRDYAYTLDHQSSLDLADSMPQLAARKGHVLVIGGGTTGLEAATEFAESYPSLNITMVTRSELGDYLSTKGQAYVRHVFDELSINVVENTTVDCINHDHIMTEDGQKMDFDACLWAGGFTVGSLAKDAGLVVNKTGQILIDRAMRSISNPDILGIGDAAYPVENPGAPVRMSCYTAVMMAAHGAEALADMLDNKTPKPWGLSYLTLCISLGRERGLTQFLHDDDTPRDFVLTGRMGKWMKAFITDFTTQQFSVIRNVPMFMNTWPGKGKMAKQGITVIPSPVNDTI